jgi:hypothetical protein
VNVGEELEKNKTKNLRPALSAWQLARKKCRVKIRSLIPILRGVVFSNLSLFLNVETSNAKNNLMPKDQSRQSIEKVSILNSVYVAKILALHHPLPPPPPLINTPPMQLHPALPVYTLSAY